MMHEARYLRVAGIMEESSVDGPGLRMAVFAQGCPHHCAGCHNPQTHMFGAGEVMEIEEIAARYRENPLLAGLTCTGGEPFCQPQAFAALAQIVHSLGGDVITYTGYTFEMLANGPIGRIPGIRDLLEESDFLVDGPYIRELADPDLPFMGSANQRFLKLQ